MQESQARPGTRCFQEASPCWLWVEKLLAMWPFVRDPAFTERWKRMAIDRVFGLLKMSVPGPSS